MCFLFCLSSALEFLSTCKLANLTVRAELGCCLLHRKGRLTIDGCILQCESNPLDYLSCPIVSTASSSSEVLPSQTKSNSDGVFVSQTRIEGGAKAVLTSGDLALQRVRVIYARTSLLFWFDVEQMCDQIDHDKPLWYHYLFWLPTLVCNFSSDYGIFILWLVLFWFLWFTIRMSCKNKHSVYHVLHNEFSTFNAIIYKASYSFMRFNMWWTN